jgi:Uncharacterized protein involved in outer membrane biogenesis
MQRARAWAQTRWEKLSQARLHRPRLKRPSNRTLKWAAGVLALVAIAVAILAAVWDWNWFRGPLARYASLRMHREVSIAGDLEVKAWSWQPRATVSGVRIADAAWNGEGNPDGRPMGTFEKITVQIRLIPLLWGDVDLRLLRFDRPNLRLVADAQGRRNWDFSDGRRQGEPLRLPPIRSFIINDGRLAYADARRDMRFDATVNASETLGQANRGFELIGQGTINRQPFRMEVTGGPLLNIDRNKPYPFAADIRAGQTFITATGNVPKPFDLGRFTMAAMARGPDLSDLYPLTGVALPNTPPYRLRGRLSRDGQIWRIDNLGGRVGDSDLAGDLKVETGRERPMFTADLRSNSLDFDDLGALFGGSPSTGLGETASPAQAAVARRLGAQQRLFPDSTLDMTRIRAMDADVRYRAAAIRDAPIDLRSGSVRVKLDNGLLRADPLRLDLPRGRVAGHIALNARKAVPATELDLRLSNARIEELVPVTYGGGHPLTGALAGRARLTGQGDSVHKAFATADGEVMMVAPGGEIREAFAELMGVNVVKGLGLLLKKDMDSVPLRCGVAHFRAADGVMTASNIVLDTEPVLITGQGKVDLGRERMAFRLQGENKKFRLVRVLAPVTAEGPIRAPKLGVEAGTAIGQGAVAAGLGALIAPVAALLPFVDPGLAKDANCGALLAEAGRKGAPAPAAAR